MKQWALLIFALLSIWPGEIFASGPDKLLSRLKDKSWPWYGDKYVEMCPSGHTTWPQCFNKRPDNQESVLMRAGLPDTVKPMIELNVTFSAPEENVDVCGKLIKMAAVKPFKLNANGYPIDSLLKSGAEAYRMLPSISWKAAEGSVYSLMFLDTGLYVIRGYIDNIIVKKDDAIGETVWPYSPPANPTMHQNPILIILIKGGGTTQPLTSTQLKNGMCFYEGISKKAADSCRKILMEYFKTAQVEGLQVYYTDGSSKYEKYRACTENLFCAGDCIETLKATALAIENNIKFMNISNGVLDMYANVNFMCVAPFNFTACCENILVNPYSFRAVSADNVKADQCIKTHNVGNILSELEMSGTPEEAKKDSLYSILMVDPDVPKDAYLNGDMLPYGHIFIANVKYEDRATSEGVAVLQEYSGPTPPDNKIHHYYILLFSHTNAVTRVPSGFYDPGCGNQCKWNLQKLPADFILRSVTWFLVSKDAFSVHAIATHVGQTCTFVDSNYPPQCGEINNVEYDPIPHVNVMAKVTGEVMEYPDPLPQAPPPTGSASSTQRIGVFLSVLATFLRV